MRGGSGSCFPLVELLTLEERGQFPDESPKIKGEQIHSVGVLESAGIVGNSVSTVFLFVY